jgi:hypothetical protein
MHPNAEKQSFPTGRSFTSNLRKPVTQGINKFHLQRVNLSHPTHLWQSMSMNTEGVRSNTTTSIEIQDAFKRRHSSRALQNSKHLVTNVRVKEEEVPNIITVLEKAPKQTLSEIRRTHSDQMFASICESNTSVGSTNTLAKSKSHTDFSNATTDMSDQHLLDKNNGKATIDRNFFKSMAMTIKGNRPSMADADVVDDRACMHYTGCCTSTSSCGEKTRNVVTRWIEGHAMRVRINLKFRLLHERIRACETSNDPNFEDETN